LALGIESILAGLVSKSFCFCAVAISDFSKKTLLRQESISKITKCEEAKMIKKRAIKNSRSVDYHDELIESLKDRDHAIAYLNAALEESVKGDEESQKLLLKALKNVAEAQGNISSLAKRSHVRRESIYRMLSDEGNPYLQSFTSLIHAMGFEIRFH
jgi:probable addiction module antidote protein